MSYQVGDKVTKLTLPTIEGEQFTLERVQGKRYLPSLKVKANIPYDWDVNGLE